MLADGGIIYIQVDDDIDKAKFKALFTINGGEKDFKDLISSKSARRREEEIQSISLQELQADATARMTANNSLKKIALAVHNYHSAYKKLPPAIVYGSDGKPWHSWRVMILPFLGEPGLFERYDRSVPWDDPKNAAVLNEIPDVFRDPFSDLGSRTRILAATGKGTAFPISEKSRPEAC